MTKDTEDTRRQDPVPQLRIGHEPLQGLDTKTD